MKLNIGSSFKVLEGYVNVDIRPLKGVDIVTDLNNMPWEFLDNSCEEIFMAHTLEHLKDPIAAMKECYRILQPGGKIKIIVPNASGYLAHFPGHYNFFSKQWFEAFINSEDNQEKLDEMFVDIEITLKIWHYLVPYKKRSAFIWNTWEGFFNKTNQRKLAWEKLGFFPPAEVHFMARKKQHDSGD